MLGWPGELDATRTKAACPRCVICHVLYVKCHDHENDVSNYQDRGHLDAHDNRGLSLSEHLHEEPDQEEQL